MTLARKNAQLAQTINVSGTAIGDTLFIASSGNLGINTNNPQANLHVVGSGIFSNMVYANGAQVSINGHTHVISDITNFNSSVSGLVSGIYAPLAGASFTGAISSTSGNFSTGLTVNNTGVSLAGHTHTASQISDFNSSVSGLLPVRNIVAGSNTTVTSLNGIYTISSSGGGGSVSDITAGSGISITATTGNYTINLKAYSVNIGDGSATSYTVTHNLSVNNDVFVTVRDTTTNYYVYPDIKYNNNNSVILEFVSAPSGNQYKVSIIGF